MSRASVGVDGLAASYLTAGEGPVVLLVHGTYWSRVWLPVTAPLAAAGLRPVAVDLPGCGRSAGELTRETATVPALAAWTVRFLAALDRGDSVLVAGHHIGGAVAQRLLAAEPLEVSRLALVNSVTYDSWPVPGVARYRDPEVVTATRAEDIVKARREALHGTATEEELEEYLAPWHDERVARSWMAMAGAADSRYTEELVEPLRRSEAPKLLVWGEEDSFQPVSFAERFATEMPATRLVRIRDAGHIPMENDPAGVANALAEFFTAREVGRPRPRPRANVESPRWAGALLSRPLSRILS